MLREWERLPQYMKTKEVRPYYDMLKGKKISLLLKRGFDIAVSVLMLLILFPAMLAISIVIVLDSKGGVFFRQERVTQYGKKFKIIKFRTMVSNAGQLGTQVTMKNDMRVTKVGIVLRKFRIDEIPQLFNVLIGDMSFVGTRPEVTRYVRRYTPEMMATLLLPAGITSDASIRYKDEAKLLEGAEDVESTYVNEVLPGKMKYNLDSLAKFSFFRELKTMIKTLLTVVR